MATVFQRDETDPRIYHEIETAMPVRSCGRFVVRCDRKGQWPNEYGVMVNGEVLVWTRPETATERAAREAENARSMEVYLRKYEAYAAAWADWNTTGRSGPEPEWAEEPEQPINGGRVVRDVQAALLARGLKGLSTADWNGLKVLDFRGGYGKHTGD